MNNRQQSNVPQEIWSKRRWMYMLLVAGIAVHAISTTVIYFNLANLHTLLHFAQFVGLMMIAASVGSMIALLFVVRAYREGIDHD